jgi:hypothetical protein
VQSASVQYESAWSILSSDCFTPERRDSSIHWIQSQFFKVSISLETNNVQQFLTNFVLKCFFFFSSRIKKLGASTSLNYVKCTIFSALSDPSSICIYKCIQS